MPKSQPWVVKIPIRFKAGMIARWSDKNIEEYMYGYRILKDCNLCNSYSKGSCGSCARCPFYIKGREVFNRVGCSNWVYGVLKREPTFITAPGQIEWAYGRNTLARKQLAKLRKAGAKYIRWIKPKTRRNKNGRNKNPKRRSV